MKRQFYLAIILFLLMVACGKEREPDAYVQTGEASYYGEYFRNKPTASGKPYSPDSLTAAHKYLPLGTVVKVTNLANDSTVLVTINDRGPYVKNRIIDLSVAAAKKLAMMDQGKAKVRVKVTKPAEGYTLMDSVASDRMDAYQRNH